MKLNTLIFSLIAGFCFQITAYAKSNLVPINTRTQLLRNAEVWFAPSWINKDFQFSDELDIINGPKPVGLETYLMNDHLNCRIVANGVDRSSTGKTPKFYCIPLVSNSDGSISDLMDADNESYKVKVKYGKKNQEIYGEILGTRLLWSLGFITDRMFFIDNTYCYGCSNDPFNKQDLNPATLENPQHFSPTAIERKFDATNIEFMETVTVVSKGPRGQEIKRNKEVLTEGWNFDEMLALLPKDPVKAKAEKTKREALLLLAAFINHLDNKRSNQKLVCQGNLDKYGNCDGKAIVYIQDLGSTFGGGFSTKGFDIAKVSLKGWQNTAIWSNASKCEARVSYWFTQDTQKFTISEDGRQFLLKLLNGFASGTEGRRRVENLFKAASLDIRDGDAAIKVWTDTFMAKLEMLNHPMGRAKTNFSCPQ